MLRVLRTLLPLLAAAACSVASAQDTPLVVLAPKAKPPGWTGVHRPHTKLADVLSRHAGQSDWTETIVDDESLFAQWISMGPGKKTPRRMNGDTREWWIVQSGALRFTVEGREPVIATKGFMVQVPYRTLYQIENVGNEPALRFEVNVTRARKLYPLDETPEPLPGFEYAPRRVTGGRGTLDADNRPVLDFANVVAGTERAGPFVTDDRAFANVIIGNYQRPKPADKGHYHEEGSEFWLIMLGKVRYKIEGLDEFEAEPGDVVYVPRQTWHLASNGGEPGLRSCRLAMNGFPYQAHLWEPD
ncbi:MAG TPA: cupin domain-containing protein [Gammaproteobacteria bacterium]|nr:cupin domain-containing protein [Gammaproteobacteria bacterium]